MSDKDPEFSAVGCLGIVFAAIAFFSVWAACSAIPVLGVLLGWVPALIIAGIVYVLTPVAIGLVAIVTIAAIVGAFLLLAGIF